MDLDDSVVAPGLPMLDTRPPEPAAGQVGENNVEDAMDLDEKAEEVVSGESKAHQEDGQEGDEGREDEDRQEDEAEEDEEHEDAKRVTRRMKVLSSLQLLT